MQQVLAKELMALFLPAEYDELFEETDEEGALHDRDDTVAALIDWADADTNAFGAGGAEDASYEMRKNPYSRKNAPYDSLEEIMLVNGVDDDFWTAFVDPEPEHPEARALTVWGSGKINPNTADPLVLMAVMCAFAQDPSTSCDPNNMEQMGQMLRYLMDIKSLLGVPFSNPGKFMSNVGSGAEGLPGIPMDAGEAGQQLTVNSEVFSIYAMGLVGRSRKRLHVVVDYRGPNALSGGKVLYWREN
jgi:general secretion pathway protein K